MAFKIVRLLAFASVAVAYSNFEALHRPFEKTNNRTHVHFEELGTLTPLTGNVHVAMTIDLSVYESARESIRRNVFR